MVWVARILILSLLCLLPPAARAEAPPPRQPILRIDAVGHTGIIRRLALSADGKILVTGSEDKTARVWSLPGGELVRTLRVPIGPGDDGKIFAVAVSPDGRQAAAGGWDHSTGTDLVYSVYVFDIATGAILARLGPNPNVADDLAFSPDGTLLAAGFGAGGVRTWRSADWSIIGSDADYGGAVYGVAFNGKNELATTSRDGSIRLYDPSLRLTTRMPAPSGAEPDGIAFAPSGDRLAIGYADTVRVDVLTVPALTREFSADTSGIDNGDLGAVAWSDDGSVLYAAGGYNTPEERMPVFAWPEGGRGERLSTDGAGDTIMDLQSVKGGGVALTAADHTIALLDGEGNEVMRRTATAPDMRGKIGRAFMASPDGRRVRFGLGVEGKEPWLFDAARHAFTESPEAPGDLVPADVTRLALANWNSADAPSVDGQQLALDTYETSRAAAIAGNGRDIYLGTDWALRRYSADGNLVWQREVPEVAWGVLVAAGDEMVIAAHTDGTVRWYRASDGEELLALFANRHDKSWIAWTPGGYYAASAGGEALMGWQVNRDWTQAPDVFPASQFHERFYRPDIVKEVMRTLDESAAITAANSAAKRREGQETIADALSPVIEIIDPASGSAVRDSPVTLHYRLRNVAHDAVDTVEILIDGRPQAARGVSVVNDNEDAQEIDVTIPDRDIEIALIAHAGDKVSVPARLKLTWSGPQAQAHIKRKLHAVFVGVSDYELPELKLGFADDDARDFAQAAVAQQGRLYDTVETRLLVDGEATADNIRDALTWLEESVGPDDVGLLFLAGHGITDAKQRFYFLPVGGDPSPDRLRATAISETEIREAIAAIQGRALFFIDACHAASSLDAAVGEADVSAVVNRMARADSGVVMFASSQGRELSMENAEWRNGAFTEVLLKGVEGAADYEKDGAITTAELNLWLSAKVKELTQDRQSAVMLKPDTVPDFPVAEVEE